MTRMIGAMIKKRAKRSGKAGKKPVSKKKNSQKKSKELHPGEVRKEISQMVESEATDMAQAVIGEGKKGQLATVKYLFEMAEIFPPSPVAEGSEEEDCLAKTLLKRMGIPTEPIPHDEDDEPLNVGQAAAKTGDEDEKKGETPEKSGTDLKDEVSDKSRTPEEGA
jgi:hypothetical protein